MAEFGYVTLPTGRVSRGFIVALLEAAEEFQVDLRSVLDLPEDMAVAIIEHDRRETEMTIYLVRAISRTDDAGQPLWWSNEGGWSNLSEALVWTESEQASYDGAPLGGEWVRFQNG